MRENCKKFLFIAGLLLCLLMIGSLSTLEDLEKIPEESKNEGEGLDSADFLEDNTVNISNETIQNRTILVSMLENLQKYDFLGRWSHKNIEDEPVTKLLDFFDSQCGKTRFEITNSRNISHRFEIYLYDGDYIDGKFIWLRIFETSSLAGRIENDNSLLLKNLSGTAYFQNKYEIIRKIEINNLSLLINVTEATPAEPNFKERMRLRIDVFSRNLTSLWFEAEMKVDESLYQRTVRYAVMVGLISIIHSFACFSLIRKILENESEGNSFSLISLSFLSIWDMYLCIVHFLLAVRVEAYFQFLVTPAFCYFALFTVFETRLLMLVWKARYFPGQSIFSLHKSKNIEILRNSLFKFYMKFYFFLTLVLILANNLITSSCFLFAINLYFLPQIIHSAIKGQLIVPDKFFIFGLALPRSFLVLYVKGCPSGIFEMAPSFIFLFGTILVLLFQVGLIYLQEYYGPRFFLPRFLFPKSFDYFLNLPDRDLELGPTEPCEDCVICLNPLHHEANVSNSRENQNPNGRYQAFYQRFSLHKKVMQTPCQHKFHSPCLLNWMSIKMECPTCRAPLPAL